MIHYQQMQIGFDLRSFLMQETGIGVYLKNLLAALAKVDADNEYYLFSTSLKIRFPREKLPAIKRMRFQDFRLPSQLLDQLWFRFQRPRLDFFFRTPLDLTHSATPLVVPTLGKSVVTVHDLFFMDYPDLTDADTQRRFVRGTGASLKKADGIIAISRYTRQDILNKFPVDPAKIRVIHHGLDKRFTKDIYSTARTSMRIRYALPSEFILFVGAIEPRKNLTILIEALSLLHDQGARIPLVIAGRRGSDYRNLEKAIAGRAMLEWVKVLDYLPEADILGLYSLASLLVLPSLCEGFGFPLLEAMAMDVPIVASHSTALPEIAEDAAEYCDPHSPESVASAILKVLENSDLRRDLIARGKVRLKDFDWQRTAAETLRFYESVAGGRV